MSRYQNCPFHSRHITSISLVLLAPLVCIRALPAGAGIVVQAKGLQTGAASGTSVHGQIRIANGLFSDAEQVQLMVGELVATTEHGWIAVDPNNPSAHYPWRERPSKSLSCMKWVKVDKAEVTVEAVGSAAIPVDIRIPNDANGLYRCAVIVHVSPPESHFGVAVSYDLGVPVLVEVEKLADPAAAEYQSTDFTVELGPRPLKLAQDGTSSDPYHTYAGTSRLTVTATLPLNMSNQIRATSAAGGSWSTTVDPASFSGTTEVRLCAKGENVNIDKLVGSSRDVRVAEITLQAMPDLTKAPFLWRDRDQTPPPPIRLGVASKDRFAD